MHKFVRSFITGWRKLRLPVTDASVVVGVSGGADSLALMHALGDLVKTGKLELRIIVAHLNHGLRGKESSEDEGFVREQASLLGVEFVSGSARLPRKGNLEQNAREARYRFLAKTARERNAFAVVTAHTKNDQAETFLMNLIRGSGVKGLSAMQPVRELDRSILLVRPLLSWAQREDTEHFCRDLKLTFRRDVMNDDMRFTRVRLRKEVIPMLAELNPKIVDTLARTAELVGLTDAGGERTAIPTELRISELKALDQTALYAVLREWLQAVRGNLRGLQMKHIQAIERLFQSQKSGNTAEIPGGGRVLKRGGRLRFENIKVVK